MIKELALSVGFDACGIAKADFLEEDAVFMQSWLDEGKHGDMGYLARNFEKRTDPRVLVPGCKSVIVVLLNYYPEHLQPADAPRIAKYAYSQVDYHTVIKAKLHSLEEKIIALYGEDAISHDYQRSFVDSAPVLERRWAQRAGLGWIGKHTQLISPVVGSYCFIGVLMVNVELEYDEPMRSRCGACTQCFKVCPTAALDGKGSIDARRCIAYLTIESKAELPSEYLDQLAGNVLGCDICADNCPWNKKWAKAHTHDALRPIPELLTWDRERWNEFSPDDFKLLFSKSAITRAGYQKLKNSIVVTSGKK